MSRGEEFVDFSSTFVVFSTSIAVSISLDKELSGIADLNLREMT